MKIGGYFSIFLCCLVFQNLGFGQDIPHKLKYRYSKPKKDFRADSLRQKEITDSIYQSSSFFNPRENYRVFSGRVSDKDPTGTILKVSSENKNIKFFRAGDQVQFSVQTKPDDKCKGHVRSIEEGYFVIYVADIQNCWKEHSYFRRGTLLIFDSPQLEARIKQGSSFRHLLVKRRKDLFGQLNDVNHFLWTYDQQKVLLAAEYDKKILGIQKRKQREIEDLISKKRDFQKLQRELIKKVEELKRDLDRYRVEKNELYVDRWHMDQDLGLPVDRRPQPLKSYEGN